MKLAPFAFATAIVGLAATVAFGVAPPPPITTQVEPRWQPRTPKGPHGPLFEASRARVLAARVTTCGSSIVVSAVELAPGYVVVPAAGRGARRVQLLGWSGSRSAEETVVARSALGRPSYGAVLLQIQGAPALPILPTTLPSQGAPRWALSGALGTSPEPRLGSVYGTTPARLGGIHTRLAMVEPSSLEPAAALVDQSGSLDLIVVDRDAAGRPLAAVPGAIVRATGEPVVSCTAVVPDS